jgi:transposase
VIDSEKRSAIFLLHEQGMSVREISRSLHVSRKAIRRIIRERGKPLKITHSDKAAVDPDLIRKLYSDCNGWVQRIYEKLREEQVDIGYSTVTRMLRELGLGKQTDRRHEQVPDQPGIEMQHDTSPYQLLIGKKPTKVIGSLLYFRYSKMRYLKFYPVFNRFHMKCFLDEAHRHFGYSADECIIDNTHLAVLYGTGKDAVMVPEMVAFARPFKYKFIAHERGHHNRKAGEERSFWFVETNFFPGRTFESLEDLNQQAFKWATEIIPVRALSKSKLIPAQLFEFEKAYLNKIPVFVPPPVLSHERKTDQYGYIAFDGNYYWVPGTGRGKIQLLQYSDKIKLFQHREEIGTYPIPPFGIKNEKFKPSGVSAPRRYPNNCKRPTEAEERKLIAIDPQVTPFLEFVTKKLGSSQRKYRFIRCLYNLSLKISPSLFAKTIHRAYQYRIHDFDTIERIAVYLMRDDAFYLPTFDFDEDFKDREAYQQGHVIDTPDLSHYDKWLDESEENPNGQES